MLKILVAGDKGIGKTSLLLDICHEKYFETPVLFETFIKEFSFENKKFELAFSDLTGEEYENLRTLFYNDTAIIYLCFSMDGHFTF
jgi:GTPase SAR1 family protein